MLKVIAGKQEIEILEEQEFSIYDKKGNVKDFLELSRLQYEINCFVISVLNGRKMCEGKLLEKLIKQSIEIEKAIHKMREEDFLSPAKFTRITVTSLAMLCVAICAVAVFATYWKQL